MQTSDYTEAVQRREAVTPFQRRAVADYEQEPNRTGINAGPGKTTSTRVSPGHRLPIRRPIVLPAENLESSCHLAGS
jgi:hypothetical protein